MLLKPYTLQMLQRIKSEHDLLVHRRRVETEVERIYDRLLEYAKTAMKCYYAVEISADCYDIVHDIMYELNTAFPECTIQSKVLTRGVDGHMYDARLRYDPFGIRLQKKQFHKLYITVDWS